MIENVESGGNYALWLMPAGPFQKYRQNGVKVPPEGLKGLEIVLEPTGVGAVTGQMMDPQGNPIPNFTLAVRSQSSRTAPLPVTSDEQGYFVVENVPEGQLRFESGSFPRFVVSGIQLAAGDEIDVDLVINLGAEQIAGQVTDDQGNPVAAASITLSWVLRENPLVHESLRKTTSGPDGHFQFTQLGTGMHMIIVRAAGYEGAQIEEEVGGVYGSGGNVDVRLAQLTE